MMKKILSKISLLSLLTLTVGVFGQVPSYIPTDSLIGYWPMNNNANDVGSNAYHMNNSNVTFTTDRKGASNAAAYFSGNSSSLYTKTYFKEFTGTVNQTYSIWFKNATNHWRYLLDYGNTSGSRFQMLPATRSTTKAITVSGTQGCNACRSGSAHTWPTGNSLLTGWHHIVIAIDKDSMKTYYDGVNLGTKSHSGFTCNDTAYRIYLASDIVCIPEYPNVYLDDLGIWNRTLSATEIKNIYLSKACTTTYSIDTITSCGPYTWTDGKTYTTSNSTAKDTFTNAAGCDSIVTLNLTILSSNHIKIGLDIDGELAGDNSGYSVSLSSDGRIVAIGARNNDGNGSGSGHVRVYENVSGIWTQVGSDIDGEADYDQSGYFVSLSSDGSIVAIGARLNDGNGSSSGHVRIYKNVSGRWTQVGSDIDGEGVDDWSGYSVSLSSDGSIVAIGAPLNDGNGRNAGHVRIYENVSGTWTQVGSDIDGEAADDQSGWNVSLSSNGSIVAIGARYNDGNGTNSGHVRVYKNVSGTWTQVGSDIDGEAVYDNSGYYVSLSSDGTILAIGARDNDGNGSSSGHVRIYKNVSGRWTQVGSDIDGEADYDHSGWSVSLSSDGSTLAIGANGNDGNGLSSGHVRVYKNVSGTWTQVGLDIDGESADDQSGFSVSLSSDGSTLAIGAFTNDGNGSNSGHVRIYQVANLNAGSSYTTDTITSCGPYTWTDGKTYTTSNNTAKDTFTNAAGCDSIVTLNLNIVGNNHKQIGSDIDGEAIGDYFGTSVSTSSDGKTVAIGAFGNDGNGSESGHVRVYNNINGTWTQIGSDIDGEASGDKSGQSVSLSSDGKIIAIGAMENNGNGSRSGHVRVYKNNNGTWVQVGSDIDGETAGDQSGTSVSLSSDGSIIAIGAWINNDIGTSSGHVRIYQNTNGTWTQVGSDIDGEAAYDQSGWSVSLSSDGSIVAIGASRNDGNGKNSGHARIFKNTNGTWTQVGSDIDGEASEDQSGYSVSLSSDGSIVAIGAYLNGDSAQGHVRVYENTNGTWKQVGSDIDGVNHLDRFGNSVSLSSDGKTIAIGAYFSNLRGTQIGYAKVYKNINGSWSQIGSTIVGAGDYDQFGKSVSLSSDGNILAIGGWGNDGNGTNSGHVRVYQVGTLYGISYSTDTVTSCGPYTWTNGVTYITDNTTARDTFISAAGCDSIVTLNLTIGDTISPTVLTQNLNLYLNQLGQVSTSSSDVNNGSSDNCGIISYRLSDSIFDCTDVGTNTIYLIVTDRYGNIDSASAVVTVQDVIKPTVLTQNVTVSLDANGAGSVTVADIDNGSTDNCTIASRTLSKTSFDCSEVGANTIYLVVTDVNGNIDSASAVVTVQDVIKPTVLTQNVTVSLDANGAGSVTVADIDNGSTDNCTIASRTLSKTSFDCSNVGANTIYLVVTDVNGNIDSASAVVTVQDIIKPTVVTTPSDIALGYCDATYTYAIPTGDDNCGVTVTQIAGLPPGSTFPVGLTVNTFEISDPSGNTVTTSFTVDIRARYMPFATPDISICNNNNKIDLSKGFDNIIFIGSGVEANEKFFNPNSLVPGSYSITAEFTDSMGCVSIERFVIEIRSTPVVPRIKRVASDQIVTVRAYNNYQWYRNGEELEGEDKQLLRVHELGIYSVLVGNDENCFEASEGYGFGIPVNEENVTNQGLVKVFPNPTRDMVFVQINDEVEFHLLTLADAVGNKLIEQETSTKVVKLDLTSLAPGTYYLNILGGTTNETVVIVKN